MMADTPSNSSDSRVPADQGGVGLVPAKNLIAHADLRHVSVDFGVRRDEPSGWLKALRLKRIGRIG